MASETTEMTHVNDAPAILQGIVRHINCLSDENRNKRKKALEGIRKETLNQKSLVEPSILQDVLNEILKQLLKLLSDPVEKCRELAIQYLYDCFEIVPNPANMLPYIMPVLLQRLGQQDITEVSEELRFLLVQMIYLLVERCGKSFCVFLDIVVKILQRTIGDSYPEVKKISCKSAAILAKGMPEHFHTQSDSLVKPLLQNFSHQHSRVRVEAVVALGVVLQYGNGKAVDDTVSHLAQRLFDHSPLVRSAVTKVVGGWLLDLPDRYSYHAKLIPLLLTSITDDIPDIQQEADALWHDVGLKYAGENENDLKDKQDFLKEQLEKYPTGVERPNLGCRELVYRHFSRILSGLSKDIIDWVVPTRIKSAKLLYILILNEEDNATQHLDKVLTPMYRAAADEEKEVVTYCTKSAELLGYFISPEVWCNMVLHQIKLSQSASPLRIMAGLIRGAKKDTLHPFLPNICGLLSDPHVCRVIDVDMQDQLVMCINAIIKTSSQHCENVSQSLFTAIITILALCREQKQHQQIGDLLDQLATAQDLTDRHQLFEMHTKHVIDTMQEDYTTWIQNSPERLIFDTLLIEAGPVVGELLEDIIPMLSANLHPEKDPEVRLKLFSLLSRLMMNSEKTLNSHEKFSEFAAVVITDMVLPNCVWKAGRTAGAIRTTAVACLWALLHSGVLTDQILLEVMNPLMKQLHTLLEDENNSTRLVTCRTLRHIFITINTNIDQDLIYNFYPDLLKRMDDNSDDIRIATCQTFLAYFDCFRDGYQVGLYRAHLEAIYKGLLIHLDDPDDNIQRNVLDVLKKAGHIDLSLLLREVETVKYKHRSTKYCDELTKTLQETHLKS